MMTDHALLPLNSVAVAVDAATAAAAGKAAQACYMLNPFGCRRNAAAVYGTPFIPKSLITCIIIHDDCVSNNDRPTRRR